MSKTSMVRTCAVTAVLLGLTPLTPTGGETELAIQSKTGKRAPAAIFSSVIDKIKRATNVPILVPSELPRSIRVNDIHSVTGEGKAGSYAISLSYEEGCAQACAVGYFAAEHAANLHADEFDKSVRLARRMRGYYRGRSCGVSCTPPEISWLYRGVLYTIQFNVNGKNKLQDEAELVALANSTIQGGER
jgi:hypothetical protein